MKYKTVYLKSTTIHALPAGKSHFEFDRELKERPDVISSKLHITSESLDYMIPSDSERYNQICVKIDLLHDILIARKSKYAKDALKIVDEISSFFGYMKGWANFKRGQLND